MAEPDHQQASSPGSDADAQQSVADTVAPSFSRNRLYVPLLVFALIVVVSFAGFQLGDRKQLPSALLDKPFPEFRARILDTLGAGGPERFATREDLLGRVVLVNVWATWCPTCLAEHDELRRIADTWGLPIVGVNYKDQPDRARGWLARYGDPYEFHIEDLDGQLGVELGVYGAPESFLLNAEGQIVYKRVGDINPRIWRDELEPRLRAMEFFN